jgi:hypothetical protein
MQRNDVLWLIACLPLIANFFSCKQTKSSFKELTDHGLTIQIMKLQDPSKDKMDITYSVRLLPDKKLIAEKDNSVKTALWYRMDSCFYLQAGKKKIYADIVQPIANGVSGGFEYLLSFDAGAVANDKWNLIYQDKYLNHRKYMLNTNNE